MNNFIVGHLPEDGDGGVSDLIYEHLIAEAELLLDGASHLGQDDGAYGLAEAPQVPLGGDPHRHDLVLVEVVLREVADLTAGYHHRHAHVGDGLHLLLHLHTQG